MTKPNLLAVLTKSSALMAARVVGGMLSFLGSLLVVRYFGAETMGLLALSLAGLGLLALFACAGRTAVAPLFVARYQVDCRPALIRGFIVDGWRLIALISLLVLATVAIAAPFAAGSYDAATLSAAVAAALAAPAIALINFNGSVLTGYRRPLLGMVPDLLIKPTLVLFAILGVAAASPQQPATWLLGAIGIAFWATAALQGYLIRRRRLFPSEAPDRSDRREWARKATPWIPIILLSDYMVELHLLLAGWLFAPALVGILHICFRLRMLASFGMRALYSVILPDIYAAHARGDADGLARDITRGNAIVATYTIAVCAFVASFGREVLAVFGPEFETGFRPLLIVCLSMIPRAVFGPATSIMAAAGRQRPMIVILFIAILLSAAIVLAGADSYGLEVIAVGYTVAISFAALLQWWWTWRVTGIDCSILAAITCRMTDGRTKGTARDRREDALSSV